MNSSRKIPHSNVLDTFGSVPAGPQLSSEFHLKSSLLDIDVMLEIFKEDAELDFSTGLLKFKRKTLGNISVFYLIIQYN